MGGTVQPRFSAAGFCTLLYAGHEWKVWHALNSTVTATVSANTFISFFIVGSIGYRSPVPSGTKLAVDTTFQH